MDPLAAAAGAAGTWDLTMGAAAALMNGSAEAGLQPVLQVTELRNLSSPDKYRLQLSDGVHTVQALLGSQASYLARSGELKIGSIVQLVAFLPNWVPGRGWLIVIVDIKVLCSEQEIIGNPQNYTSEVPLQQDGASLPVQASEVNSVCNGLGVTRISERSYVSRQNILSGFPKAPISEVDIHSRSPRANGSHFASTCDLSAPSYQNRQNGRFSTSGSPEALYQSVSNYKQPESQPSPVNLNRRPIKPPETTYVPIAALNPYNGRWTIKARVTARSALRGYKNPRGEGKVFNFDLLDSQGGEIRATCFNYVADQFYDQIVVGKVYLVSGGMLKPAQKKFNPLNCDFEITLESSSRIEPCFDEDNSIPSQKFEFKRIDQIEILENNSMVDLIGVVSSVSPVASVTRKDGTGTHKRTLQLKDMSRRSIEITLWGNFSNVEGQELQSLRDSGVFPVFAIKAGRVCEFNGKSVGTISSSQLFINPDFDESKELKEWHSKYGKHVACPTISREVSSMGRTDIRKTIAQITNENLGRSDKADWVTVKAAVSHIKAESFFYTACPLMVGERRCNKKVTNNGDGSWHCEKCDQTSKECVYRYVVHLQIQDHTGVAWATAFDPVGEEIMGISAKDLYLLKYEEANEEKFADVLQSVRFCQFLINLKVKEEAYNDEQRVKCIVSKAEKTDPSSECHFILGTIKQLMQEDLNAVPGVHNRPEANIGLGNKESRLTVPPYREDVMMGDGSAMRNEVTYNLGPRMSQYGLGMNQVYNAQGGPMQIHNGGTDFAGRSFDNSVRSNTDSSLCFRCQQPGHWAKECPGGARSSTPGSNFAGHSFDNAVRKNADSNMCFECRQPGHWARQCPGIGVRSSTPGSGSYATQNFRNY